MIYEFNGYKPVVHPTAFVHPLAAVTGNVRIGANVYVGPFAAIRGDWGEIILEEGSNVQESCTIHQFPGTTLTLKTGAHIGHGAIVHGANVGRNSLVGMNAVLMDDAIIGDECIVGALCFVPSGMVVPNRKIVVGNPAKMVKDVSDEMLAWKTEGTQLYQSLPAEMHATFRECTPLTEIPPDRTRQKAHLKRWKT